MIDGFDGEKGAIVAGSRGYFLKVSFDPTEVSPAAFSPFFPGLSLPSSGPVGVPGASSHQLRPQDAAWEELQHALHAFLHEEGSHAGSGPAQPV